MIEMRRDPSRLLLYLFLAPSATLGVGRIIQRFGWVVGGFIVIAITILTQLLTLLAYLAWRERDARVVRQIRRNQKRRR